MSFFVEWNIRTERLEITMITVNEMGDTCPIPVVKTKNAIKELNGAGVGETLVDNEIAAVSYTHLDVYKRQVRSRILIKREHPKVCVNLQTDVR